MNAPAHLPALPLGSTRPPLSAAEGENPPSSSEAVGHQTLHPDYLRLFGQTRPELAITVAPFSSPGADGTCGPSHDLSRAPKEGAAGHPLPSILQLLTLEGHPSARSLASIAQLRERHISKGLTTATDADRGPAWWWHGVHEFWWKAHDAGDDRIARRKALVAAAALIVARIDVEDFLARQQEAASHE